ncbi:F1-ATP synthase assembly protein [Moesziomyces antarcticus T-34]|uniref:F1-ATP synthase assembly protein n=1 Tax=Pseudozyma antarctica (strain T-34) TaxID=1151754 RepID=M9MCA7_PSEA3|nr:F1-ATP synthase assembly protein [Moesziomyces antarcticus T-34]
MAFSEDTKERIVKAVDVSKTLLHYGWVPFVLYIGFTRSTPQPSLINSFVSSHLGFLLVSLYLLPLIHFLGPKVFCQLSLTFLTSLILAQRFKGRCPSVHLQGAFLPTYCLSSQSHIVMSRLSSHAARPGPKRRLGASLSANPASHTFTSSTGQAASPTRPFPNNNPTSSAFHSNAGHSPQRWPTILPQAQQESQNEWAVSDAAANHRTMAMESNGPRGDIRQFEYAASPSRPTSNGRDPGPTSQMWAARDAPIVLSSSQVGSPHPEQGFSRSRPNTHTGEASQRHPSRSISPFVAPPRTAPGSMPRPHSSTSLPTKTMTTHDPLETHMRAWLTRVEQSQSEVLATVQRLSQAQEVLASEQRELAKSCSTLKESHEESARTATNQLAELHRQSEAKTAELLQEALRDHSADYAKRQVKTIHDVSTRIEEAMSRTHAVTQAQLNNIRSSLESVQSFFSEEMNKVRAEQREIARQERRAFYAEFADMRQFLAVLQARESGAVVAAARSTSGVVSPATRSDTPEEFETVRLIANKKNKAKGTESQSTRERVVTRSRSGSTLSLGPCGQVVNPEAQQHRQETPQTVAATASSPVQEPTRALEIEVTRVDEHRSRRESPRPSRTGDEDPHSKAQKRKERPGQRYGGASKRQRRAAQVAETEQGGPSSPAASSSRNALASVDIVQEQEPEQDELPPSSPPQPSARSRKKRSSKSSSSSKSGSRKNQKQEPRGRARTRSRGSTRRPSVSSHTSHPVAAGESEEMPQGEEAMLPYRYQTRSRSLSCARAGISLLSEPLE